jgi:hypothetical protein
MDRAMFLQALRDQEPEQYKRLSKSGELDQYVTLKLREAARLFDELATGMPRDARGDLPLHLQRETEEYLRAEMLQFMSETSTEQDELNALSSPTPIISTDMVAAHRTTLE